MDLIIVESPHKAQTINKILGSGYTVKASVGHIRDLSPKELNVDLETLKPKYSIIPDKHKIIGELKKVLEKANNVIIASDPDREGEAIGWHLTKALNLKNYKRAEFHEITEKGIKDGLKNLRTLDMNLVSAQEARRVLDRLIGYGLSPDLRKAINDAKSAGRVQTAALRIIVEREKEIKNFIPEDRYAVELNLEQNGNKFIATVVRKDGEEKNTLTETKDKSLAEKIIAYLQGKPADIINITHKDIKRNPPAPFTTSTYQQAVNSMLGISGEEAMKIAQKLYEEGYITYMRTDSVRLSDEAVGMAKGYIISKFGDKYFENRVYKNKDGSQDAHEAIRPADVNKSINGLSEDELKVYNLILNRFIASQMSSAIYDQTVITVKSGGVIAEAHASVMKFKGYKSVYNDEEKGEENVLSGIEKGKTSVLGVNLKNWKTKPPARFTESSIIKELEDKGIGRPSTYAQTVKNLKMRAYKGKDGKIVKIEPYYIAIKDKKIIPTELGIKAVEYLVGKFDKLFDVNYTALMEEKLDEIAKGKLTYKDVVKEIYDNLKNHNIDFTFGDYIPSPKQIEYAERVAKERGVALPECYKTNGRICSEFIENNKSVPKASEKQIELAEKLAKEQCLSLPEGYKENIEICSKFIDKAFKTQPAYRPSEKQIAFAEKLSEEKGLKLPKGYKENAKVCKEFIDKAMKKKRKNNN
jgi:DNA topoisomerase-1